MRIRRGLSLAHLISASLLFTVSAAAQTPPETDPIAILEIGAAPSHSITGGGTTLSPTIAAEFTPIENWLELEIGTTPTFSHHTTEWDTDLLFKKPWTLSKKVEFMLGAGPVWVHTRENHAVTNGAGAEVALDFMFWPSARRRFGWYVEPAYQHNFGSSRDQSIAISVGLLIPIRR
jgi:hypothetical protein